MRARRAVPASRASASRRRARRRNPDASWASGAGELSVHAAATSTPAEPGCELSERCRRAERSRCGDGHAGGTRTRESRAIAGELSEHAAASCTPAKPGGAERERRGGGAARERAARPGLWPGERSGPELRGPASGASGAATEHGPHLDAARRRGRGGGRRDAARRKARSPEPRRGRARRARGRTAAGRRRDTGGGAAEGRHGRRPSSWSKCERCTRGGLVSVTVDERR